MKAHALIFVLWANRFDETVATIFVTELRRMGLPVQVVGLHRQPVQGAFGLALMPDVSLEDVLPLAHPVRCLIVPGPWQHLQAFQHDPRLRTFLNGVSESRAQFVAGSMGAGFIPADAISTVLYPAGDALLAFARNLAQHLRGESTHSSDPRSAAHHHAALSLPSRSHQGDLPMNDELLPNHDVIRVAANSHPAAVAGAIAGQVRQKGQAEVQAIGAGAVNQMMKAAIIARHYLQDDHLAIGLVPSFVMVEIQGWERTALRLFIFSRPLDQPLIRVSSA